MTNISEPGAESQDSCPTHQTPMLSSDNSSTSMQSPGASVLLGRLPPMSLSNKVEPSKLPGWVGWCERFPAWAHLPTEEPISPEVRAQVRERLRNRARTLHLGGYIRDVKSSWNLEIREERYMQPPDDGPPVKFRTSGPGGLFNCLTSFYWMPSPETVHRTPTFVPLSSIFKHWFRYHNGEPYTQCNNTFTNLVLMGPFGPTTVQETIKLHKHLYKQEALLRERMDREEEIGQSDVYSIKRRDCHLRPTLRAIIIMMDNYYKPLKTPVALKTATMREVVNLDEIFDKQTVLLVRTGDDSHLRSRVTFEELKASGLCLPLDRSDVTTDSDDVVRVSLPTAVKFISDLDQKEDVAYAYPERARVLLEEERWAKERADELLKEADEKGIDNVEDTWFAVRHVKAAAMGEDDFPRLKLVPDFETRKFICTRF